MNSYERSSDFFSVDRPQIDAVALSENPLSIWPSDSGQLHYCHLDGKLIKCCCLCSLAFLDNSENHNKLCNAYCMKDILERLCFNNTQKIAKKRDFGTWTNF